MITVLAGGVGAARFLRGLVQVVPREEITVVANVGDDLELHGLHISPDLDTITYTLAGAVDAERGWGLEGETWQAMAMLGRYGGVDWFNLGDRDLGTHLHRTHRLREGATLSEVTAEIAAAWDLGFRLLPASDDPVRTLLTLEDGGEVAFQDYFVRLRHEVPVSKARVVGGHGEAEPAPGVLSAIADADAVVVAPSNPLVSIGPVLAVDPIAEVVAARLDRNVAISPIVGGKALKGPADRLLTELGWKPGVEGVAQLYQTVAGTLVVDPADAHLAPEVEAYGVRCVVHPSVMVDDAAAADLARATLATVGVEP